MFFDYLISTPGLLSLAAGYKKEFGQWAAVMRAYWGFINGTGRELKHEAKHTQLITPWVSCTVHTATQSVCLCVRGVFIAFIRVICLCGREENNYKQRSLEIKTAMRYLDLRPGLHNIYKHHSSVYLKKIKWFELIISLMKENLFRAFVFLLCYMFAINIWYQWEHHPH